MVRLQDVANVLLGSEDYKSEVGFDGKQAVYIGIQIAPACQSAGGGPRRTQDVA